MPGFASGGHNPCVHRALNRLFDIMELPCSLGGFPIHPF